MILNYLLTARRNILRNKLFSLINIAGLSLGLACCILILLYASDEIRYDNFQANKDQIYRVTATMRGEQGERRIGSTNVIVGPSITEEVPGVRGFVRMEASPVILRHNDELISQELLAADSSFFSTFTFPLLAGDPSTVLSANRALVLTESRALEIFGHTNVVGETIEINSNESFETFEITGVAKDVPSNSSIQFEAVTPFGFNRTGFQDNSWVGFYINTFVILAPDTDPGQAESLVNRVFMEKTGAELASMKEKFNFSEQITFALQPFSDIHLDKTFEDHRNGLTGGSDPVYSYILSGIALFILLIACINFVNLTIAHSLGRAREIGIRKTIGGRRKQLLFQFLGESLLICFIAFCVAIVIVQLTLPYFNALAGKQLVFSAMFHPLIIVSYLILFLVTGVLAGLYPAVVLSGYKPIDTLYNKPRFTGRNLLAKGLVILQFSLATLLMIGTAGIFAQFDFLISTDLGYNADNLMVVHFGRGPHENEVNAVKTLLDGTTSIDGTGVKDFGQNYTIGKVNDTQEIEFAISWIDENYLPLLEIPIVSGRNFHPQEPSEMPSVIVNETFAREAGWVGGLAIGETVDYWDRQFTITGVVKDHHYESLREKIKPQLYVMGSGDLWIKITQGKEAEAIASIQQAFRQTVTNRPPDYDFVNVLNRSKYEQEARWRDIISIAAAISVFISCTGLFALALLSTRNRIKEIGIRKVLGAEVSNITVMIIRDFLLLILASLAIAIPAGYFAMDAWLQHFAYRTDLSWWIFALAGMAATTVAVFTTAYHAISVARINPAESLRSE